MKKKLVSIILLSAALLLIGCGNTTEESTESTANEETTQETETPTPAETTEPTETAETAGENTHHAEIVVKDYGTIKVELDGDVAPVSVENFMKLANEGFYDGLTFHRIIDGFMIQGGDPKGDGTGGSEETIKGEFSENGVENNLSHTRGAISMARSIDMDSASSQFFIVHEDSDFLDGQYACFGYVTEGMDIVDAICEETPVTDSNGSVEKDNQPEIETITIVD